MAGVARRDDRADKPSKAIALMVLGTGLITVNDAMMKWVVTDNPLGEAIFVRGLFALLPTALLLKRYGGWRAAKWHSPGGQLLAAVLLVLPLYLFVFSLSKLSLGLITVILYTNPVFVAALAPRLLGERVSWRRWAAVGLGFAGALLVLQPGGEDFSWLLLLPLIVAVLVAFRDVLIRTMVARETSVSILIFSSVAVMLCALPTAAFGWKALAGFDVMLLGLAGLAFGFGIFSLTDALRYADASLVSPFKYSGVVFALLLSYFFWDEIPSTSLMAGAALIVLSGLFVLRPEKLP